MGRQPLVNMTRTHSYVRLPPG